MAFIRRILKRLQNKTAGDSILVLTGNVISQALSFVVIAVVGRFLSVTQYGVYSVLNNISGFVTDMADMGMNGAITRFVAEYRSKKDAEKEQQLIHYAIRRKAISLVILFIVLVSCARPIAEYWLHDAALYPYIYLVIVSSAFSLFVSALRAILQGRQEFKRYFVSIVTANAVWCAAILIMSLMGRISIASSVLAHVAGGAVDLIVCIFLTRIDVRKSFRERNIDPEAKKNFNTFGIWMLLWAICAILQSKLDIFMLATFTTPEQVSYYDIATKVTRPILMVVSAYAQVLNPQFASMTTSGINDKIKTIAKFIGVISGLLVVAIFLVGPALTLVFGNKYDNSVIPARLLLFAIVFYIWTVPFNSALYAYNKPYVFTLAALIGLIVTAVGDYFLLGKYGAVGAAYTFIAAQVVGLVIAVAAYVVIRKKVPGNG